MDRNNVALRKESVDRNLRLLAVCCATQRVALRKESVDRNFDKVVLKLITKCRSPQGERG